MSISKQGPNFRAKKYWVFTLSILQCKVITYVIPTKDCIAIRRAEGFIFQLGAVQATSQKCLCEVAFPVEIVLSVKYIGKNTWALNEQMHAVDICLHAFMNNGKLCNMDNKLLTRIKDSNSSRWKPKKYLEKIQNNSAHFQFTFSNLKICISASCNGVCPYVMIEWVIFMDDLTH